MGVLVKLHTFIFNKILLVFLLEFLPDLLRLAVLGTRILWKHYKLVRANRAYVSAIDNKSPRFSYHVKNEPVVECSICLSELVDGEEGRRVVDCCHTFHRRCLEKWVLGYCKATCPLCRGPVAQEAVVAEYREMRVELEDSEWIKKELALILLSAAWGSSCNGCPLV
ncbi:RING/U-box superfamily protein [Striga hermonthica]|uniref:RING/U-box superfamily protein n=1 Tax=Striga hermonthica TaxID=68872 RepID=A0A9N7P4A9_STRHE|nr:RING/U-box superfamily protein [Striga hermonthica]